MTAGDVILEAQTVYLNDSLGANYPSAVLLPILSKACKDLEIELQSNGVSEVKEISSILSVPINTLILNTVAGFPSDLLDPIELKERASGGTLADFVPMRQLEWEPTIIADEWIKFWDYREGEIKLNPAISVRDVLIRYIKSFVTISGVNTVIPIVQAGGYLAARVGAIAAANIGENPTRAQTCQTQSDMRLIKLLNVMVKQNQSIPVRRRRFNPFQK